MPDHSSYQVFAPASGLEPFVECFWDLVGPASATPAEPEIVLPDGKTELLVHFGDDFFKLERNSRTGKDTYVRQARVLMSGQLTERILLRPSGRIGVVSVRFKAAGAARFFDLPYEKIVDQVIEFSRYEKEASSTLAKRIEASSTPALRFQILQDFLIGRLRKHESKEDVFVRQACQYIVQSEGSCSVQELVRLIGFSERQMERKFKQQVGITPKLLSRIMRFQKFIALARSSKKMNLADASVSCGYHDQSHFIRDFTKFSGVSPREYLSSSHPLSDHLTTPSPPGK